MPDQSISSIDEARAANPELGMALYCYEPGGPVTLEILTPDGQTFTWIGATETAVLALAFPPEPDAPVDENADRHEPTTDIFD